jgi:4-amino-4-deoxy-L-arabinose transferase-like glycosyltransferase
VLLLVYIYLTWQLRIPAVTTGNDDARYLHLARAIAGFSYRELWVMGAPIHSHSPPFYPFILAVAGFFSGHRLDAYLILNLVFVVTAFLLFFDAVRRLWSPGFALLMLMMLVANPGLVRLGGELMSEAQYLALSALALWIPTRQSMDRKWMVAFGTAAILAALTRSVGITLLFAVFLLWILERRWRALSIFSVAAGGLVGSWLLWTALAPHELHGGRTYMADVVAGSAEHGLLLTFWERVTTRLPAYLTRIVPWELPLPVAPGTVADNVVWLAVLVGLGALGVASTWRRWRIFALYLLAYGGLLALWAWVVGRFLTPVIPLMVVVLLAGTDVIRRRYNARLGLAVGLALAVVVFLTGIRANWERLQEVRRCDRSAPLQSPGCFDPDQRSLFAATSFVAENTPDSTMVITAKDATFSYYSGRRVTRPHPVLSDDPAVFVNRVVESGVDYLFLGRNAAIESGSYPETLRQACRSLELVKSFPPSSYLFRLGSDVAPDTTSAACRALAQFRSSLPRPRRSQARP